MLRYDLFGRGYSDRPKVRYDIDLFCKQLRELLGTLGLEQINLIGLSMGGPITASFTAHYRTNGAETCACSPSGCAPDCHSATGRILKAATTPGFGELAFGLVGSEQMVKSVEVRFL